MSSTLGSTHKCGTCRQPTGDSLYCSGLLVACSAACLIAPTCVHRSELHQCCGTVCVQRRGGRGGGGGGSQAQRPARLSSRYFISYYILLSCSPLRSAHALELPHNALSTATNSMRHQLLSQHATHKGCRQRIWGQVVCAAQWCCLRLSSASLSSYAWPAVPLLCVAVA